MFYQIRFILTKLENSPLCVLEVKISAAPIGEMYMNSSEQVSNLTTACQDLIVNSPLLLQHVSL